MKYSLLLVEDEGLILESLQDLLKDLFSHIDVAKNGIEAYEMIEKNSYDIVITDILMPLMSGEDLTRRIRMRGLDIPVIFMTGNDSKQSFLSAIKLGVIDFIQKPFAPDDFYKQVQRLLNFIDEKKKLDLIKSAEANANNVVANDEEVQQKRVVGLVQVSNFIKYKNQE